MNLPSVEAIEYGRSVIANEIERLQRFEDECNAKGETERAAGWRKVRFWLDRMAGEGQGCVITPFDKRKLDPEWRAWYEDVLVP